MALLCHLPTWNLYVFMYTFLVLHVPSTGHLLKLQMGRLFNTNLWLQQHPDPGRMALHEVEKGKYKETADKIEQKLNGGF